MLSEEGVINLQFSFASAVALLLAGLLGYFAGWEPWMWHCWLVSRPGWQKLSAGLDANRAVLVALEGTAMLMAWAVALCPFGILVAWASIFFRSNSLPPLYGVLVLLGGVGLLFGVWAVLLWRQAGFSPRARPPATAAAAAAFFLTAFVTGAAFSGGGTGIFRYTTDGLFFAIMSLAFGLSLVPLVPLATIAGTPANGGLSAFAERAFAAMSTGAPAPPWHTGGAQAGGDAPGCQGVLAQRARAVPLFVAAQLLSLSGALAFALLAEGNRGTGFVAAGAVIVADAAGALAWNSGLVLHRAPGTYLVAAGVARGSVLLFPVSRWFLGHALLFALVASALASAAAARRWPLRDAATRRREELADTLNTLRVLAPHHSKVGEGAQRSTFPLTKEELAQRASWLVTTRTGLWAFLSAAFAADLAVVAWRQPPSVPGVNSRHPQWQYGVAAFLAAPAAAATVAFVRAWAALPKDLEEAPPPKLPGASEAPAAAAPDPGFVSKACGTACAPVKAAAGKTVGDAVGWFWTGTLSEHAAGVIRHLAGAAATIAACAIALAYAADSSVVLALGVFGPVLVASAQALARDAGTPRPHEWDPRKWTQAQRRAVLWLTFNVGSLAALGLIIALDPFRKRMAREQLIRPTTPYARAGYHALAVSLGCAFAEAAAAALTRIYHTLEISALGAPLSFALVGVPAAWLGSSLAFVRAYRRGTAAFAATAKWDVGVAVVTAVGAPGLLAFLAGLLMWRDAADWAPTPPAGILALLGGGLLCCAGASVLIIALLFPVLGGGLLAATCLAAVSLLLVRVWAKNGRSLPRAATIGLGVGALFAVGLGLASGVQSSGGFRGFSVSWLLCSALGALASARPLFLAPRVLLSPTLVPAYRWDPSASRVLRSTWCVLGLAAAAAAVFAWAAVASTAISPPSGGAAAAIASLVMSLIAAAAAIHASQSADSDALDTLSPEGLAIAAATAGRAVGIGPSEGIPQGFSAGGAPANPQAPAPAEHVAVSLADPVDRARKAEEEAAERFAQLGLALRCAVPLPPAGEDGEGARAARCKKCSDALNAQRTAAEEHLRFSRFHATLSAVVRQAAEAEAGAEDAALRAFLVSLGYTAGAEIRWTAKERERIASARAAWVELKKREREEDERREREAEEARRRRAAAAAAALKKRREQSLGIATCEEVAAELIRKTAGGGVGSFTDDKFPANNRALYVNGSTPQKGNDAIHERVSQWRRCTDYAGNGAKLFTGGTLEAQSERVQQGGLGDCWAISAIAVLASQGLAEPLFLSPSNPQGAYCVRFFRDGMWEPIVIDDKIPCSHGGPAFATSKHDNEMWVPLLEKAYAKFYGAYEELEGGWISDALEDMTGGDASMMVLTSDEAKAEIASGQLWARLRAAFSAAGSTPAASADPASPGGALTVRDRVARVLLGCGSQAGKDTNKNAMGIVLGHAYSIMSVHEVDGTKLLKLRNPWGSGVEWKGAWSDGSAEWTPRMTKMLAYNPQKEDGVFWMEYNDWLINYRTLYFCHIYPQEQARGSGVDPDLPGTPGIPASTPAAANRHPDKVLHVNGSWKGDGTVGGQLWMSPETWVRNSAFLLKREDGAERPTAVYVSMIQSELDEPNKKVQADGGAGTDDLAAGTAGGHMRACVHSSMLVRMRFDIFRETGELFDVSTSAGKSHVDELRMHSGTWTRERKHAVEITLPPSAKGWIIVPTCMDPKDAADYSISVFATEKLSFTPRHLTAAAV